MSLIEAFITACLHRHLALFVDSVAVEIMTLSCMNVPLVTQLSSNYVCMYDWSPGFSAWDGVGVWGGVGSVGWRDWERWTERERKGGGTELHDHCET